MGRRLFGDGKLWYSLDGVKCGLYVFLELYFSFFFIYILSRRILQEYLANLDGYLFEYDRHA